MAWISERPQHARDALGKAPCAIIALSVGTASPILSASITSAGRSPSTEIISTGPAATGATKGSRYRGLGAIDH